MHLLAIDDLPPPLAVVMRTWIAVIGTATLGMGNDVKFSASVASTGLQRRIVMTSALEDAIETARDASEILAVELDRKNGASPPARAVAEIALEALVGQLGAAKPSARAKGLGLGW